MKPVFADDPNASFGLVKNGLADFAVTRADVFDAEALALLTLRKSSVILWNATRETIASLKDVKGGRVGVVGAAPR